MKRKQRNLLFAGLLILGISAAGRVVAQSDDARAPAADKAEVERLRQEVAALKAATEKLEQKLNAIQAQPAPAPVAEAPASTSGTTQFMMAGYATGGYSSATGEGGGFGVQFSPVFLWKLSDRILFESEVEFRQSQGSSEVNMEYAQLSVVLNPYMNLGMGKFLTPFSTFQQRFHPAWISKSIDKPVFGMDPFIQFPESTLGLQLNGGIPLGDARLRYAVWAGNGPSLNTAPEDAGTLAWDPEVARYYNHENRSYGVHLWVLPVPEFTLGAAVQSGYMSGAALPVPQDRVSFRQVEVDGLMHLDKDWLKGVLDLRGEVLRMKVENLDYGYGPVFNNTRGGGYGQLFYRPSKVKSFIRNWEFVTRYDWGTMPADDPNRYDESRWTVGFNYYFSASTVLKTAYRFDSISHDASGIRKSQNGLQVAFAVGF